MVQNGRNVPIATRTSNSAGVATLVYTTTRGTKTFRATFQAPRTIRSGLASASVRVS
jgi:hypothetical protein